MYFTAELFRFLVPAAIPSSARPFRYCEAPRPRRSHHRTGPAPSVCCPARAPHPGCSGQGSFPLTCCQTSGSPRLAAALPAPSLPQAPAALRAPLDPRAARALSFYAARRRLLSPSATTPTAQPSLLGTPSARGRCRRRSRVIPGSSAKLRPRPGDQRAPTSQDAAILPRRLSHDPAVRACPRGVVCAAPRDTGVVEGAGPWVT